MLPLCLTSGVLHQCCDMPCASDCSYIHIVDTAQLPSSMSVPIAMIPIIIFWEHKSLGCGLTCAGPPARETSGLGKLESLKIPRQTRQRVEDAVESLGGRVTVGDVSSRAGLTLGETERTLNALAADSEGTLQVTCKEPCLLHASTHLATKLTPCREDSSWGSTSTGQSSTLSYEWRFVK